MGATNSNPSCVSRSKDKLIYVSLMRKCDTQAPFQFCELATLDLSATQLLLIKFVFSISAHVLQRALFTIRISSLVASGVG